MQFSSYGEGNRVDFHIRSSFFYHQILSRLSPSLQVSCHRQLPSPSKTIASPSKLCPAPQTLHHLIKLIEMTVGMWTVSTKTPPLIFQFATMETKVPPAFLWLCILSISVAQNYLGYFIWLWVILGSLPYPEATWKVMLVEMGDRPLPGRCRDKRRPNRFPGSPSRTQRRWSCSPHHSRCCWWHSPRDFGGSD